MAYIANQHTLSSKPIGISQAVPTDARSYYYDSVNFKYRAYLSASEVLAYLDTPNKRTGHFPIIINSGGSLLAGVITGGTNAECWFKDGVTDGDLVVKNPNVTIDSVPTSGSNNAVTSNGVFNALAIKQPLLIPGTNIKTINGVSILGSGDLVISGGGGGGGISGLTPGTIPIATSATTIGNSSLIYSPGQLDFDGNINLVQGSIDIQQGNVDVTDGQLSITISSNSPAGIFNSGATTSNGVSITANSITSGKALNVASSTTTGQNNHGTFRAILSGVNGTSNITSQTALITNSHSGTGAINIGVQASATGGTINDAIRVTVGDLALRNLIAATSTVQQSSPKIVLEGQGWATTPVASLPMKWEISNIPISSGTGVNYLTFNHTLNNGTATTPFKVGSDGIGTFSSRVSAPMVTANTVNVVGKVNAFKADIGTGDSFTGNSIALNIGNYDYGALTSATGILLDVGADSSNSAGIRSNSPILLGSSASTAITPLADLHIVEPIPTATSKAGILLANTNIATNTTVLQSPYTSMKVNGWDDTSGSTGSKPIEYRQSIKSTYFAGLPSASVLSTDIVQDGVTTNISQLDQFGSLKLTGTLSLAGNIESATGYLNLLQGGINVTNTLAGATGATFTTAANSQSIVTINGNSITTGACLSLNSSSTGANSFGTNAGLKINLSGAQTLTSAKSNGAIITNTKTGTNNINIGINVSASGGAKNYALVSGAGQFGIGTTIPVPCAILEVNSNTQGVLLPRMTKADRDAIVTPVAGLAVYQTDNTPGLRVYNGTSWMKYSETAD